MPAPSDQDAQSMSPRESARHIALRSPQSEFTGCPAFAGHDEYRGTPMPSPTLPRERVDYSAIVDRPPLKLPGGARIVFWSIVNLEVWDIGKPMARQVLPAPTGAADAAGRAELELARIRHARRRVALLRPVPRASASRRRSRSMRASARTTRASRRRRRTPAGSSWAIPTNKARSTKSPTRPR